MRRVAPLSAAALLLSACATTPEETEKLRAQNELLKAEIEVIKRNCSYYREVQIEAEEEDQDRP